LKPLFMNYSALRNLTRVYSSQISNLINLWLGIGGDGEMGRWGDGEMGETRETRETRRINPAFPVTSQQSTVNTLRPNAQ
ncbi:hypothetical protein VF13_28485, partial [Nostoc linckia z16]